MAALFVGLAGDTPLAPPARIGLGGIDRVDLGRGAERLVKRGRVDGAETLTIALADGRMSSKHARLSRVGGGWVAEDLQSKNGTWIGKSRIARRPLADGDVMLVGHTAIVFRVTGGDGPDLHGLPSSQPGLATLSPALAAQFAALAQAARSNVPIEITGESGTGKELIARAAHAMSGRRGGFVAVNCGALAGGILEGELFVTRRARTPAPKATARASSDPRTTARCSSTRSPSSRRRRRPRCCACCRRARSCRWVRIGRCAWTSAS